ncbi:MAG: ABC transporter substrate-binding protein [Deltaproteobacteria bacterium]|nr:ABC transporter substrate-binding protein [Deltaproteobacteria bacterium]
MRRDREAVRRDTAAPGGRFRVPAAGVVVALALLTAAAPCQGQEITDLFGRRFAVAERPRKVFAASPPLTQLLYALDPMLPAGLNFPLREREKPYLHPRLATLPVLGGWFGQGHTPNLEMILKTQPEIVLVPNFRSAYHAKARETIMNTLPAPVIGVSLATIHDYPEAIRSLGRLLGRPARAGELAAYAEKVLADMAAFSAAIPERAKVSVYYAEGVDGLSTECDASMHTELIPLAGGRNVHRCAAGHGIGNGYGMEKIAFEQVMAHDPEVILVFEKACHRTLRADPRWQRIRAVRERRVYLIPDQPFNWFDRPPSFMRLLGAKWVASRFYPEGFQVDLIRETQDFFRLFLGVELSAEQAARLLEREPAEVGKPRDAMQLL